MSDIWRGIAHSAATMPKSWYSIRAAAAGSDTVEAAIHDEIGYWGVTGSAFISDLKAQVGPTTKAINLSINSPGGSVFDGWAIFNALKATKIPVNVTVMGIAASMASVIAMAGTTIKMPANSMMMVHNAISGVYGDAADMRDVADVLDKIDNSIVATYVARTGKTEDEVRALMANDTFMTAAEALDLGFATEVTDPIEAKATYDIERLPENVRKLFEAKKPTVKDTNPSLFTHIETAAKARGLGDFLDVFVTDATINTTDEADAAIEAAASVIEMCVMVKRPDDAGTHIRARAPLKDVRAALAKAKADESDATNVDTTRDTKSTQGKPTAASTVNPSAVWKQVNAMNAALSGRSN